MYSTSSISPHLKRLAAFLRLSWAFLSCRLHVATLLASTTNAEASSRLVAATVSLFLACGSASTSAFPLMASMRVDVASANCLTCWGISWTLPMELRKKEKGKGRRDGNWRDRGREGGRNGRKEGGREEGKDGGRRVTNQLIHDTYTLHTSSHTTTHMNSEPPHLNNPCTASSMNSTASSYLSVSTFLISSLMPWIRVFRASVRATAATLRSRRAPPSPQTVWQKRS